MVIVFNIILFLVGWIAIVLLFTLSNQYLSQFAKSELIADGNNLFKTGVFYTFLTAIAYFFDYSVVKWIVFVILVGLTIFPIISVIKMYGMTDVSREQKVSATVSQVIPLIMAINLLLVR